MKIAVEFPDPEVAARDLLAWAIEELGETADCTIGVPAGWSIDAGTLVQVRVDGTDSSDHPIALHAVTRVTVFAAGPSAAKALAGRLHGLVLGPRPDAPTAIVRVLPLIGPAPAGVDPDTRAELAWFTVRTTVRAIPI